MDYHDPDEERRERAREPRTVVVDGGSDAPSSRRSGWLLVAAGIVGFVAAQLWQFTQFRIGGASQVLIQLTMALAFLLATSLVTAGLILVFLRRWLLPELRREIARPATAAERAPAGDDEDR